MSLEETIDTFLGSLTTNLPDCVEQSQREVSPTTALWTLTAKETTALTHSGTYDKPNVFVSFTPSQSQISDQLTLLAFQCSEFALPIRSDATLKFNFFSRPGFIRPHAIFPVIIFSPDECLFMAPLDAFHEQIIAVRGSELQWGWSGDLEEVHTGFSTTLAVLRRSSPRQAFDDWGAMVRSAARNMGGVNDNGRYADVSVANLSYWTDNGSAYWYRTEPGMDLQTTLERTIQSLDDSKIPIASIELDSWFYEHEVTRKVTDVGYLEAVPPTGMLNWEPRPDVLPDGVHALRKRLKNRPLVLHSRHMSSKTHYKERDANFPDRIWWTDGDRAHPVQDHWFRTWMQQASDWGASTYEQDWLIEVWLGVRGLRARPGRIFEWQKQLNDAAAERAVSLIWCMASPADMANAVSLKKIVSVRSSDDYRYADDPSILWRWHLTISAMLRSLGLWPYKDVFMSHGNDSGVVDINGDPNALLESCLAALSGGPVGIGDRLNRTERNVVMKCCRNDGVIIKPDYPLAALDRSLYDPDGLLWAETNCGPWRYIVSICTGKKTSGSKLNDQPLNETFPLDIKDAALVYNWKTQETWLSSERNSELSVSLRIHEWALWVICPIMRPVKQQNDDGLAFALIGDPDTFATTGDRRFRIEHSAEHRRRRAEKTKHESGNESHFDIQEAAIPLHSEVGSPEMQSDRFDFDVLGTPEEEVSIAYWTQRRGVVTEKVEIPLKGWLHVALVYEIESHEVVLQKF